MLKPFKALREPSLGPKITKRSFWNRFPINNLIAMQSILRSGSPALLAGRLSILELLVSESPYVDVSLAQTISGVQSIASTDFPATIDIEGQTLPLRLTQEQVNSILATASGSEVYKE